MGWPEDIPHQNSDNTPQDALWILNARYSEQDEWKMIFPMLSYFIAQMLVFTSGISMYVFCDLFTKWAGNWMAGWKINQLHDTFMETHSLTFFFLKTTLDHTALLFWLIFPESVCEGAMERLAHLSIYPITNSLFSCNWMLFWGPFISISHRGLFWSGNTFHIYRHKKRPHEKALLWSP